MDHIFSAKHVAGGIDGLGSSRTAITEKIADVLSDVDGQGLLKSGSNQIETILNGQNATIRAFIDNNGMLRSIDAWAGTSERKLGNLIIW